MRPVTFHPWDMTHTCEYEYRCTGDEEGGLWDLDWIVNILGRAIVDLIGWYDFAWEKAKARKKMEVETLQCHLLIICANFKLQIARGLVVYKGLVWGWGFIVCSKMFIYLIKGIPKDCTVAIFPVYLKMRLRRVLYISSKHSDPQSETARDTCNQHSILTCILTNYFNDWHLKENKFLQRFVSRCFPSLNYKDCVCVYENYNCQV